MIDKKIITQQCKSLQDLQKFLKHRNFLKIKGRKKWVLVEFNLKTFEVKYYENN